MYSRIRAKNAISFTPCPPCYFWDTTLTYLDDFGIGPYLVDFPIIPMHYLDANVLLALSTTPLASFFFGLSCYAQLIEDPPNLDEDAHQLAPLDDDWK